MKKLLFFLLIIFFVIVTYLGGVILFATLFDYRPDKIEEVRVEKNVNNYLDKDVITIFDWNIGYAGLGKEMDFFLDGGKNAVVPKNLVKRYINGVVNVLKKYNSDIYLLQEIDVNSRRTNYINELSYLKSIGKYDIAFAYNYKVLYVPVPFLNPMGKVSAGLATFSKYEIGEALRISLPGEYSWPTKIFQLDRCVLLTRLNRGKKDLVILNIHPSAYDTGVLREKQLRFIMKLASDEYKKGNYVIIGGDWNSEFFEDNKFTFTEKKPSSYIKLPDFFNLDGWSWGVARNAPTNRSVSFPYKKGENFVTVIDGFYVSPNVEILEVKNLDLNFEYSDHNPVILKVRLK
ncbi:endonuclease [Thermosipho sp. 1063]|uniref:endonuclease/exonuclease/phosphatase family protein n=1 Tax=unclassified Thermosipho (in: thermotogales) TaxID=2676525 RepID=UPI0009494040|nr:MULTISPECIES: endonuclease/exonuclease/phosphatase family protein [unclassified Thermosipho (in: thermotogales)]ANQ54501.1 endonuclease [Thermosipho sp. 1070]APT72943.1 endonuclease [Thermosipho sp. 1063]OOC42385.1 endonuclease [Thermosipho sp. 1074]